MILFTTGYISSSYIRFATILSQTSLSFIKDFITVRNENSDFVPQYHGAVTPRTKAFLTYVDEHIVSDKFTHEIEDELTIVKNDPANRRELIKYEMNIKDATLKGEEIGIEKGVIQSIVGMLKAGIDYELIAKATNCPLDRVKDIAKQ